MSVVSNDEDPRQRRLVTKREPKSTSKDVGQTAVNDALLIVLFCWVALFAIMYSLRHHLI